MDSTATTMSLDGWDLQLLLDAVDALVLVDPDRAPEIRSFRWRQLGEAYASGAAPELLPLGRPALGA